MSNEERLEKTIAKAYSRGWKDLIFEKAQHRMKSGEDMYSAFGAAYHELEKEHEKNIPRNSLHGDARK